MGVAQQWPAALGQGVVQVGRLRKACDAHHHGYAAFVEPLMGQSQFFVDGEAAGGQSIDTACAPSLARVRAQQPAVQPALLWWCAGVQAGIFYA